LEQSAQQKVKKKQHRDLFGVERETKQKSLAGEMDKRRTGNPPRKGTKGSKNQDVRRSGSFPSWLEKGGNILKEREKVQKCRPGPTEKKEQADIGE